MDGVDVGALHRALQAAERSMMQAHEQALSIDDTSRQAEVKACIDDVVGEIRRIQELAGVRRRRKT